MKRQRDDVSGFVFRGPEEEAASSFVKVPRMSATICQDLGHNEVGSGGDSPVQGGIKAIIQSLC